MKTNNVLTFEIPRLDSFKALWKSATPTEKDQIRAIVNGDDRNSSHLRNEAKQVIEFLNLKTGRKYRAEGSTLDTVIARLRSGVTLQQMKAVIAKKSQDWRNDERMERYLRPKTLFGRENFENYLGEIGGE